MLIKMCRTNPLCLAVGDSCLCSQTYSNSDPSSSTPLLIFLQSPLIVGLVMILKNRNEMLESISSTLVQINTILESPPCFSLKTAAPMRSSENIIFSALQLESYLSEESQHLFTIRSVKAIMNPVYKERVFSLLLEIVDLKGKPVILEKYINFKVEIFSAENPPKKIKHNTVGDSILKGTTVIMANSTIIFSKIAVKEVSSHFRGGCFFLVIMPHDCALIKPFVIADFVVKARKTVEDSNISKKAKKGY